MRTILLAELRGSLRTWLGVSLAFVATSFALLLPGLVWASVSAAGGEDTEALSIIAGINMVLVGIVGLTGLGTATNLALGARRGALALLALNGATPRQIVRAVIVQLVVVSLLTSVVGSVLAMLALRSALTFLILGRRNEAQEDIAVPEPVYSLPAPSWQLARRAARARAQRLLRSVIPVMMTVGLLLGIASIVGCLKGSFEASGIEFHLVGTGWMTMLTLLGLPLLLSLTGGVGSLIMMSKQRDAELALLGVVGATPRQRVLIPLLEAVTIAATVLPTLGAHRMPEPAVIARMVAD